MSDVPLFACDSLFSPFFFYFPVSARGRAIATMLTPPQMFFIFFTSLLPPELLDALPFVVVPLFSSLLAALVG